MPIAPVHSSRANAGSVTPDKTSPAKETPEQILSRGPRSRDVVALPGLKVRVTHTPGENTHFPMRRVDISALGGHIKAFSDRVDRKAAREEEHARWAINRESANAASEAYAAKVFGSEPSDPPLAKPPERAAE